MEWVIVNWWWISWVLSVLIIPTILFVLKKIAKKTKNVHDDKIVTLIIEWYKSSKNLLKLKK